MRPTSVVGVLFRTNDLRPSVKHVIASPAKQSPIPLVGHGVVAWLALLNTWNFTFEHEGWGLPHGFLRRREIGFVFSRRIKGAIRHNSFSAKPLPVPTP
jgi:hypothetical protein